ncbi:hypothetical protein CDS [Bradyrhizobium sp.]|nr:hypothetical protein CDS [Bradyrhizobium sp.]
MVGRFRDDLSSRRDYGAEWQLSLLHPLPSEFEAPFHHSQILDVNF